MSGMARTNYWNPNVSYIGKNSAQDFMNYTKSKLVRGKAKRVATSCGSGCVLSPCDSQGSCVCSTCCRSR